MEVKEEEEEEEEEEIKREKIKQALHDWEPMPGK